MTEKTPDVHYSEQTIRETSEERAWETPGYLVVETALEVTAYALGDR
jgi:coenzyme PQQ precursor peptide PqqA